MFGTALAVSHTEAVQEKKSLKIFIVYISHKIFISSSTHKGIKIFQFHSVSWVCVYVCVGTRAYVHLFLLSSPFSEIEAQKTSCSSI